MNKWLELLIGIILVVIPILAAVFDWFSINLGQATLDFIKGGIVIVVILIGILLVVLGISDIKG